jgi:hypothetical protein
MRPLLSPIWAKGRYVRVSADCGSILFAISQERNLVKEDETEKPR